MGVCPTPWGFSAYEAAMANLIERGIPAAKRPSISSATSWSRVKAEKYADLTDEDLAFTKNEATAYFAEVDRRLGGARLDRVFILVTGVLNPEPQAAYAAAESPPAGSRGSDRNA